MGKSEIRLRRHTMNSGRIARYRNYEDLLARHERDVRIKRLSRLVVYILIIVILICTFLALVIIRDKKNRPHPNPKPPAVTMIQGSSDKPFND